MTAYTQLQTRLTTEPHTWLVTGVAGFIGSNLLETLLKLNQRVVGLDNFATGHQRNLDEVQTLVTPEQWTNFHFIKGDIRNQEDCRRAMHFPIATCFSPSPLGGEGRGEGAQPPSLHAAAEATPLTTETHPQTHPVEYVLHQAALGSVPRSIEDPITTNETNITGFLNMLVAARDAKVSSFVYAASSSTYGDHPVLPKIEENIGKPLSPYAVTKYVNELYADVFARTYSFRTIGLRYFNIFGPRQDPNGAYAAVIPKWIAAMIENQPVYINGDGETSRDFCYIENAIQANLLAATTEKPEAVNKVYNVAVGDRTTLNVLFREISDILSAGYEKLAGIKPIYRDFRIGDVPHSQADIRKASALLNYAPYYNLRAGLSQAIPWYLNKYRNDLPLTN